MLMLGICAEEELQEWSKIKAVSKSSEIENQVTYSLSISIGPANIPVKQFNVVDTSLKWLLY